MEDVAAFWSVGLRSCSELWVKSGKLCASGFVECTERHLLISMPLFSGNEVGVSLVCLGEKPA